MNNRIIYVVSDSVGETAELVVKAALSQFNGSADDTHVRRIPYVEDIGTINEVISLAKADGGIICFTLVQAGNQRIFDSRSGKSKCFIL